MTTWHNAIARLGFASGYFRPGALMGTAAAAGLILLERM